MLRVKFALPLPVGCWQVPGCGCRRRPACGSTNLSSDLPRRRTGVVCGLPARRLVNNFLQAQITISPPRHVHRLRDRTVQVQASSRLVFSIVKNRFGNVEETMSFMEVARMVIIRAEPRPLV